MATGLTRRAEAPRETEMTCCGWETTRWAVAGRDSAIMPAATSRAARRKRNAGRVKEGSPVRWTGMNLLRRRLEPLERPDTPAIDFDRGRRRRRGGRGRPRAGAACRLRAHPAHERADPRTGGPDAGGVERVSERQLNAALLGREREGFGLLRGDEEGNDGHRKRLPFLVLLDALA